MSQPVGFATYKAILSKSREGQSREGTPTNENQDDTRHANDGPMFNSKFEDVKEIQQDGQVLTVTRTQNQYRRTQETKRRFGEYSLLLRRILDLNDRAKAVQLEIQSETLRLEFRRLARGLTSISLNHNPIIIPEPYKELYHCREKIRNAAQHAPEEVRRELQLLVNFQDQYMSRNIEAFKAFKDSVTIEFDFLWGIFEPGRHVVIQNNSATAVPIEWCAVLESYQVQTQNGVQFWTITVTHTGFNGQKFGNVQATFTFPSFSGTVDITQLPAYPLQFCKHEDLLREAAIARGAKYEQYCADSSTVSAPPIGRPMTYEGPLWTPRKDGYQDGRWGCRIHDSPSGTIDGRVIVDVEGFLSHHPVFRDTLLPEKRAEDDDDAGNLSDDSFYAPLRRFHSRSGTVNSATNFVVQLPLTPEQHLRANSATNFVVQLPLSPEQHLTCPPVVPAFSFTAREWGLVLMDGLRAINWNPDIYKKLQIDEGIKATLRSIVKSHSAHSTSFDDFIQGKGRGLVFLLHGPPGCGKTMTAESIAESLRKPLYYVSGGELGSSVSSIQKALERVFGLVSRWDAVFLLDEADAFMAERRGDSVERNALISVLLRLLEYQAGIVFLTTNRRADFDKAFHSRIHITIPYSELTTSQRKSIWQALADENRCKLPDSEALALGELPIDGRTIKNILRMASLFAKTRDDKAPMSFPDIVAVLPLASVSTGCGMTPGGQDDEDREAVRGKLLSDALSRFMSAYG